MIKLAEDTIEKTELEELASWITETNQITKGPLCIQFEKEFSNYIGCKYSVFVNSGSSANLVMFYALLESGRLRNKKVIVPAVSWITTLSPAIQLGLEPILCDSDKDNLGLDITHLEKLITEHKPAALILVHVLGHVNKMDEIYDLCNKNDILLLEDACEALGTIYKDGRKTGNLGLMGSFSFYYGHHISTIEGGMVTTNDRDLYNIILSIRSHGWSRDIEEDYKTEWRKNFDVNEFRNLYTFYYPGYNLRSTDLNAFLGISQLKKLDNIAKIRNQNFELYKKYISKDFWVQKSEYKLLSSFAFGTFVANPQEVYQLLKSHHIESRPLICGSMGRQPFWIKKFGVTPLKVADKVHYNGIYLPNHANMNEEKVKLVTSIFNQLAKPI